MDKESGSWTNNNVSSSCFGIVSKEFCLFSMMQRLFDKRKLVAKVRWVMGCWAMWMNWQWVAAVCHREQSTALNE